MIIELTSSRIARAAATAGGSNNCAILVPIACASHAGGHGKRGRGRRGVIGVGNCDRRALKGGGGGFFLRLTQKRGE